jgi:hypothetical protein
MCTYNNCTCVSLFCNNSICSAHALPCSNSFGSFSPMAAGDIILAAHQTQFRDAINGAHTRQSKPPYFGSGPSIGDVILASHYNEVSLGISSLSWSYPPLSRTYSVTAPSIGDTILSSKMTSYKNEINSARNECYCNFNCTCDIFCDPDCSTDCDCNYGV